MSTAGSCALEATLLRAIQIEAGNAAIYDSLAHLFQGYDQSVEAIFREMAAEERQHGALIEERYRDRYGLLPATGREPKEVIEAPDLEDAEAFIFDSMTVEQALASGLRAEESAREFYRRETVRTTEPQLQQLFRELAEFEQSHVRLLQEKLAERERTGSSRSRG